MYFNELKGSFILIFVYVVHKRHYDFAASNLKKSRENIAQDERSFILNEI